MPARRPVLISSSFSPLSAVYATRWPSGTTWMTRLPAVVTVPPLIEPPPGTCQRFCFATGSQAMSTLRDWPSGGGSGPIAGGGGSLAGGGCAKLPSFGGGPRRIPILLWLGFQTKSVSIAKFELLLVDVGMYTSPVAGLNDMGDQLCAPPGPGMMVIGSVP